MTKTAQAAKDLDKWLAASKARVADDKLRMANRRLAWQVAARAAGLDV